MWGIKRKQIGGIIFYLIRQLSESLIWELKMIAQLGPRTSQAKPSQDQYKLGLRWPYFQGVS